MCQFHARVRCRCPAKARLRCGDSCGDCPAGRRWVQSDCDPPSRAYSSSDEDFPIALTETDTENNLAELRRRTMVDLGSDDPNISKKKEKDRARKLQCPLS